MRFVRVENGKVVSEAGGFADVPWWSFAKTVLAAAALVLVAEDRLSLDAPLRNRPYTLRQLLQHRAGLREYGPLPAYHEAVARHDAPWSVDALLARVGAEKLLWAPGSGWAYSNIGYLFVRQMIEETCGTPLDQALRRLVFSPLEIESARVALLPDDLRGVDMGTDSLYHPGWVYHGLVVGPLAEAALLPDRLLGGALLPADLMATMRDGHPLGFNDPARPERDWAYGLGLMMGRTDAGGPTVGHTGGGPGSVIAVRHMPEQGFTGAAFQLGGSDAQVERCAIVGAVAG